MPLPETIYSPTRRQRNQDAIRKLINEPGASTLQSICGEYVHDFHPSLFAELDWQEFRPDLTDDNTRQILGHIDDFLFFTTTIENIGCRDPGGVRGAFSRAQVDRFGQIFGEWQDQWLGPSRGKSLAQLDEFVRQASKAEWVTLERRIRAEAETEIAAALDALTDPRRLDDVVSVCLQNASYRYLDLPWSRRRHKTTARAQQAELGYWLMRRGKAETDDPDTLPSRLRLQAELAHRVGDAEWAMLLESTAERVQAMDRAKLDGYEGEWSVAFMCCARCAMWFAAHSLKSIDSTCRFVNWSKRGLIYLPPGICTAQCPFCGLTAPASAPAMFYAEQRAQIVYLVPTNDTMTNEDAIEFWRSFIESIRDRFKRRIDADAAARFDQAADLMTHTIREFLYAIQMGETITEDHTFNVIELSDGSALMWDGEKRFARVITPGELAYYTQTGHIRELDGSSPSAAYDAISGSLKSPDPNAVEELLAQLADANDEIDAIFKERRRRAG